MNMDICIIGAGIAGLTAAIYAQRAGLTAVVLERNIYGGQITESAAIDNYPGMAGTDGATLANALYEQATAQGAQLLFEGAESVEKGADGLFTIKTNADEHTARAVIFAGGATHRKLGCEGEARLAAHGVSYCATCDGAFHRGKTAAVVGGGNTALEDALFLANMCEKVYIIHRRDSFRGDSVLAEAVLANPKIEALLDAQVAEITGEKHVDGAVVRFRDGSERRLELSGVFIAVGVVPDCSVIAGLAQLDEGGYVVAGEDCATTCEGLFVAGDCRTKQLRQLVTAAADGANAAFAAGNHLAKR